MATIFKPSLKTAVCALSLLLVSTCGYADELTPNFQFDLTKMATGAVNKPATPQNNQASIGIYVLDDNKVFIAATINGKKFKIGTFGPRWVDENDCLRTTNSEGASFTINMDQPSISFQEGNTISLFNTPASATAFKETYNALSLWISLVDGLLDANNQSSETTSPTTSPTTSGALSPLTFALHPFGFMPASTHSQAQVINELKRAGWPAEPYSDNLISILSTSAFQIPLTMYGRKVTGMSHYIDTRYDYDGMKYDLEVSDFNTNWTRREADDLAKRIIDELIDNGYVQKSTRDNPAIELHEVNLVKNKDVITIGVGKCSLFAKFDAFKVSFSVQPNSPY